MRSSSPARIPKLQLAAERPSTGYVSSHQKQIPHVQGQRRSHSKTVGGAKSHLKSNPIPTRDPRRAHTKPFVLFAAPGGPSETEPDLPLSV